jgi:NADPH:quinone reductase-like Zn-dependent oxidoreductase
MPESGAIARKPPNLSFDEAAALSFGGMTAMGFFRRAKLARGEKVLVNGASGGVGSAAVQIARQHGAEVTGVCSSANVDLVRSLGADHVIDYTREDFTRNGERYDIIVDTAGTAPFSRSRRSLARNGRCLQVLGGLSDLLRAPWASMTTEYTVIAAPTPPRPEDMRFLAEIAAAGQYTPFIDRRFTFDEMAEAHRYVEAGRKRGSVVVSLNEDSHILSQGRRD